jgi:hypothetical protein
MIKRSELVNEDLAAFLRIQLALGLTLGAN